MSRLVGHGLAGEPFGMEEMLSDYARMVLGSEVALLVRPWAAVGTGQVWE